VAPFLIARRESFK